MGIASKIEWTDSTFNHVRGCTKVAAGCTNCYADSLAKRNPKVLGIWGDQGTRVLASDAMWREPLKWNADAEKEGVRRRVFCASLSDVFEDWKGQVRDHKGNPLVINASGTVFHTREEYEPCFGELPYTLDDARVRLFNLIDATPHLDWLLLTKRPENIRRMWPVMKAMRPIFPGCPGGLGKPLPCVVKNTHRQNCWLGTSIATQQDAEKNVPELLKCRDLSQVLFLSVEPLLGPIELNKLQAPGAREGLCYNALAIHDDARYYESPTTIDWVIVGGESGRSSRPCDVEWIRSLVSQCKASDVPVFVKQLGSRPECRCDDGFFRRTKAYSCSDNTCRRVVFDDSKGGNPDEWPKDLRVREFPTV